MLEVEIKLKISNVSQVREHLLNNGFVLIEELIEKDVYYDNMNSQIKNGDSALRIRQAVNKLTGEETSMITYKGVKADNRSMTRPEFETMVGSADVMNSILQELGYKPVIPVVIKNREQYSRENMNACLDVVEGLGTFLELEIVLAESLLDNDSQYKKALEEIEAELNRIGYSMEETTNISYLSQLQDLDQ